MIINLIIALIGLSANLIVFLYAFKKISNYKFDIKKSTIIYSILGVIISYLFTIISNGLLTNIFTILLIYYITGTMTEQLNKERFYYSIIIWLYGILADIIIMLIVSLSNLTEFIMKININYVKTCSTMVMILIIYIICSIPFIKKYTQKLVKNMQKIKFSIFLDVIVIFMLIFLSILCAQDIFNSYKITFYISVAIVLVIVMLLAIDKYYNIKRLKEINEILLKNNDFFIKLDSDYRILKHNLTNQLLGIKAVSNGKVENLIEDLILKYNTNNNILSQDISKIPRGLNGLVYEKLYTYNNQNINIVVNNSIKTEIINNIKPRVFNNLCETLGVLLDNALEASSNSEEKIILINFEESITNYFIEINNSFNSQLDIDSIGTKNYSTKQIKSGIGIFSILNKKDVAIKNSINNSIFHTQISIKKSY